MQSTSTQSKESRERDLESGQLRHWYRRHGDAVRSPPPPPFSAPVEGDDLHRWIVSMLSPPLSSSSRLHRTCKTHNHSLLSYRILVEEGLHTNCNHCIPSIDRRCQTSTIWARRGGGGEEEEGGRGEGARATPSPVSFDAENNEA